MLHEAAARGRVRHVPAEIDLDLDDLPVANDVHFRILKASAKVRTADIGHVDAFAARDHVDELEIGDPLAVWPAAFEIGLPIEAIVERAREMEILGDEPLHSRAILVDVGEIAPLGDFRQFGVCTGQTGHAHTGLLSAAGLPRLRVTP